MKRREILKFGVAAAGLGLPKFGDAAAQSGAKALEAPEDRAGWVAMLDRVCRPVFLALSQRRLKSVMPVESHAGEEPRRRKTTYLEALGRALAGIAPWLEHGPRKGAEADLRARYCEWALQGIAAAVDPGSPDYMEFGVDRQTIVDTAFLSLGLLRAPRELIDKLPPEVRKQLAEAMRATRVQLPPFNNWLLFAAMTEAALCAMGERWDRVRVDYALREHSTWYVGDGTYGDGPQFHQDYYNSFVIHPFLLALMDAVAGRQPEWAAMGSAIRARAQRYAAIQERLVAPDGSYPILGRSIAYRCGAFHLLADVALRKELPAAIRPEQVRGAISAVIRRTLDAPGTFDRDGWLTIGLAGHQPALGEAYISTGSLYLCMAAFLPLGLPAADPFWSGARMPWSSVRLWNGENIPADHALDA